MMTASEAFIIGWTAFFIGLAYGQRCHLRALRDAAQARAIVIDARAYVLSTLVPGPGGRTEITITVPANAPKGGDLVVLPGGKGDAA